LDIGLTQADMQKHAPKKDDLSSKYPQALEGSIQQAKYFFFETGPDCNKDLAIVFGGFEICSPDFEIKRSTYPYYILEYVTKGRCSLEINHKPHQLKKGTLGGFTPGVPHHYKNDPQHPMEHIFVAFIGSEAAELFRKCSLDSRGVIELANPGETFFLIEQILKKGLEKTEYSQPLCCHYLRSLLLEQACRLASSGPSLRWPWPRTGSANDISMAIFPGSTLPDGLPMPAGLTSATWPGCSGNSTR